jgi:hypothetical protein
MVHSVVRHSKGEKHNHSASAQIQQPGDLHGPTRNIIMPLYGS